MELRGERILLREFASSDVDALHAVHSDPAVLRYYAPEVGTRGHAGGLVEMFIGWALEEPRENYQLAIVDAATNTVIGSCGVRTKSCPAGTAEFGIGIRSNAWGRGIAREAATAMLQFAFSELGLSAIRGVAVAENEAVSRFAGRLGFESGSPRRGEPWMTERGWSASEWSMTREDWEKQA